LRHIEEATAEAAPSATGFRWGLRGLPFFYFFGFFAAVAAAGPLLM
jgi:hypothetical protein